MRQFPSLLLHLFRRFSRQLPHLIHNQGDHLVPGMLVRAILKTTENDPVAVHLVLIPIVLQ